MKKHIIGIILLGLFIGFWQLVTSQGWVDTQFFPSFTTVLNEIGVLIRRGEFFSHISISLFRLITAFALAFLTGVPLGFLLGGKMPRFSKFILPLFTNLSFVNPFTIIPVFMLLLGLGEEFKIVVIFYVVFFPILFATISGIKNLDASLVKMSESLGAGSVKLFWNVVFPGSIDRILTGLRSSVTLGFTVLISAEFLGASKGIGFLIFVSQQNYNIPRMYVGILITALTGVLFATAIDILQYVLTKWKPKENINAQNTEAGYDKSI